MANNNDGNQFREDEIIVLDQSRDGKMAKNLFPKIGGRRRLPVALLLEREMLCCT
jgi:hypothetical protein